MKIIETDIMHAFLSVLCVSVHWNSKLEQASFICCSDFVFLLLGCLLFTSLFTFTDFVYIVCLQDKRIYIYVLIELIYYIIKELEITDAVVFQTACIAQDDFFTWHHLRRVFAKLVWLKFQILSLPKQELTFFYIIHLQFSVKMNLLLLVKVLFRSSLKDEL